MDNPYSTPASNLFGAQSAPGPGGVSDLCVQHLARTKGWVRFLAILGFIGAGFMILAGVGMLVGGGAMMMGGLADANTTAGAGIFGVMGVFYIAMSLLYLFPSIKLWKYGSGIANLMVSRHVVDLEKALDQQRGFWKFVGIAMIIGIGLIIAYFAVVAVVMAATIHRWSPTHRLVG